MLFICLQNARLKNVIRRSVYGYRASQYSEETEVSERAPVKSNTPSSLPSSNAVSRLQLQVARPPQPTADQ
jgi:hypothetical protein